MRAIAATLVLLLAGCAAPVADETDAMPGPVEAFEPQAWTFEGEFLAGGVDEAITYTFTVPNGTTEIEGLLTWTIPGGALDFRLLDPNGDENGNGWAESKTRRYVTSTYAVVAGAWTVEVTAQEGADIHFAIDIEAREAQSVGPLSGVFEIPPGNALRGTAASPGWTALIGRDFAEVNLNMVPGNWFNFTWESDGEVYFNVHFHNEGSTDRPIEHTGSSLAGNFSAPANEVYSLLWRNTGTEAVSLTYEMAGEYRLHSISRD